VMSRRRCSAPGIPRLPGRRYQLNVSGQHDVRYAGHEQHCRRCVHWYVPTVSSRSEPPRPPSLVGI
jgi:hypothetical protein